MARMALVFLGASLLSCGSCAPPQPKARRDLTMTIVYDNNPYDKKLETKWGFGCLITGTEKTILFDTGGDGKTLLSNMRKLGLRPASVDIVVLSHIHGDHTGGLSQFLHANSNVTVYMLRSFPGEFKRAVVETGAKVVEVHEPAGICRRVHTTGEVGKWIKEQALVIETAEGLVVVTGCAHPGIVEMVRRAREVLRKDVYLVLGGFHLGGMSAGRIGKLIGELRAEKVQKTAPVHCSGDLARKLFGQEYKDDFILGGVGKTIRIEDAFPPPSPPK